MPFDLLVFTKKYNNKVVEYYSKDIRDMIELKYLCDYTIHIPIFSDDPDNKKICEHLLKNYKNIIIYCNSQKEGKQINVLEGHQNSVYCLHLLPNGNIASGSFDNTIRIWSFKSQF